MASRRRRAPRWREEAAWGLGERGGERGGAGGSPWSPGGRRAGSWARSQGDGWERWASPEAAGPWSPPLPGGRGSPERAWRGREWSPGSPERAWSPLPSGARATRSPSPPKDPRRRRRRRKGRAEREREREEEGPALAKAPPQPPRHRSRSPPRGWSGPGARREPGERSPWSRSPERSRCSPAGSAAAEWESEDEPPRDVAPPPVAASSSSSSRWPGARAKWAPCKAVSDFWMSQCQASIGKKSRCSLRAACPRPWLPDRSTQSPRLNPGLALLLAPAHAKRLAAATRKWWVLHEEALDMVAPAMTVYEMAEEALAKREAVEPLELREWARHLLRYVGSLSQRVLNHHRHEALAAIHPRLRDYAGKMAGRSANGKLFAEDKARWLEGLLRRFPRLTAQLPPGGAQEPADGAQPDSTRPAIVAEDVPDAGPSSSAYA